MRSVIRSATSTLPCAATTPTTASPGTSGRSPRCTRPWSVTGAGCCAVAAVTAVASPGTGSTRSNNGTRCCGPNCGSHIGSCRRSRCCEATAEERGAGNPHATFCGNRRRATASGDPVRIEKYRYRQLASRLLYLVVAAPTREVLATYVVPKLTTFLGERGLKLSEAKTRIV